MSKSLADYLSEVRRAIPVGQVLGDPHATATAPINDSVDLSKYRPVTPQEQAAALSGFVAGFLIAMFGMAMVLRNPSLIGPKPFSSVEAFFSFMGSVLIGLLFNSWLVAGIASLSTLPISLSFHQKRMAS
jgi:hypothetical protein